MTGKELSLVSATTYFTSSDPNIATVDDWGVVTAVSPGQAIITANVTMNGISKSASVPVYITKNNQAVYSVGFFSNNNPINKITKEMDNLTAKAVLYNGTGETIENITIYAAVYDGEKLVNCKIANYPELTAGEHELSATLEKLELTDTCTAKMFVWNSEQCPQMNADGI